MTKKAHKKKIYLVFENAGVVDINGLKLIGASSKESDTSKIGFFGSGLKYALSIMLREKLDFHIFAGKKEIKIDTTNVSFRGDSYDVITVDGEKTSMTTRMGKDWQLWFVIREIYANMMDEGNNNVTLSDSPVGKADTTRIYVEFDDRIKEIWSNRDEYFAYWKKPAYTLQSLYAGKCKVYEPTQQDKLIIYRKGIKVYEETCQSHLFDYDFDEIAINESRVVQSTWEVTYRILATFKGCQSTEVLEKLFAIGNSNAFESRLDWKTSYFTSDNAWLAAINGRILVPSEYAGKLIEAITDEMLILPLSMCTSLLEFYEDRVHVRGLSQSSSGTVVVLNKTPKQQALINDSLAFLKQMNIDVTYSIIVAKLDSDILGTIDGRTILLSEKVFDQGRREVALTIFEEYLHIKTGLHDKTRAFQDFLISKLMSMLEERSNTYL